MQFVQQGQCADKHDQEERTKEGHKDWIRADAKTAVASSFLATQ